MCSEGQRMPKGTKHFIFVTLFLIFRFLSQGLLNFKTPPFITAIKEIEEYGAECAEKHLKDLNETRRSIRKPPDLGE